MEEIQMFYNTSPSGSDTDDSRFSTASSPPKRKQKVRTKSRYSIYNLNPLPPPPSELDQIPDALIPPSHAGRKRTFPHVEGNFPSYVNIPVPVTLGARNVLESLLGKASSMMPQLRGMDDDIVVSFKRRDTTSRSNADSGIQLAKEFHISLSRTVPIRVHQIDTLIPLLRHKFESQKRFWIEFGRWEVYLNDDRSRTFLGLEVVSGGLSDIRRQIALVTEAYKLHGLPPFYDTPRPHISLAWALGDVSSDAQRVADELNELCGNSMDYGTGIVNVLWSFLFGRVDCKVGQQLYPIWVASTASHT
ncbi:hypothetical protein SELMODRAFT_442940 [Selaginella moellendorffii]|uniref:U6 snRNA phosphodiesterase n=1 Tax=Selaginella moellendorffii TaxID=88036 RepID=D8RXB8_SELML|nr:U6 snRNA phosphodiesterase [Selaginella moellendorffii]XP_024536367.1 U6 snRNA phosphodiesterase [Selaginella moellendorffii]EFJ23408.1 hypothetical protein SELMODRAFT_442940 [Selaginella moellendorffii]|eukprot:XP_002975779.1 U6 snRNA phosphodiesterase [Selaginella moellendorffii]